MNPLFPSEKKRIGSMLVPYVREGENFKFFLQKRSAEQKNPHRIGFFGGGLEANETAEEGLIREISEELSIAVEGYEFFTRYEFPRVISNIYILETTRDFSDRVRILEGESGRFFSIDELKDDPAALSGTILIVSQLDEYLRGRVA